MQIRLCAALSLRLVGEVGCDQAASACVAAMNGTDPAAKFWATWSSVMVGNRGVALDALADAGLTGGPHRLRAFRSRCRR